MNSLSAPRIGVFASNSNGRDFVIGDLHGDYAAFNRGLKLLSFDSHIDRIFSVGDLIDRGPQSALAVNLLKMDWFFSVLGNHEQMLLDYHRKDVERDLHWFSNGGTWWLDLEQGQQAEIVELIRTRMFLAATIGHKSQRYGLIHADIPLHGQWEDFLERLEYDSSVLELALWSRRTIKSQLSPRMRGVRFVISGHTPQVCPSANGNIVHIDTGAGQKPNSQIPNPALTFLELGDSLVCHRICSTGKLEQSVIAST